MELLIVLIVLALLAFVGGLLLWGFSALCTFVAALFNSTSEVPPV